MMKNFTVTFTLNDEPSDSWSKSFGITDGKSHKILNKVREGAAKYIKAELDKGEPTTDNSQMIVWMLENDYIDPRAFIMIFNRGLTEMIGPRNMMEALLGSMGDED